MSHPTQTDADHLEPLAPDDALQLYLDHREHSIADATYRAHRIRVQHFIRWCTGEDITNLNTLSGRDLHRYRLWRRNEGDLNRVSVRTQMSTLKVFIRFCAHIDGVEPGLEDKVDVPELDTGENAREVHLSSERATDIIEYLRRYEYASRRHVLFELLWHTAMRIGAAHGLDVGDVDTDEQSLAIRHRAEYGTALKNKTQSQRRIALNDRVTTLLADWLEQNRPDETDDMGRAALFATKQSGRMGTTTIRNNIYRVTAPSFIGDECPCDVGADGHTYHDAAGCPESVSPHAIRRGAITHHLRTDTPKPVVSDRCDVSQDVLDRHYNELTEAEKMEQRREFIGDD